MPASERRGIAAAGNWIVDNVKIIDTWPQEETLANILSIRFKGIDPERLLNFLLRYVYWFFSVPAMVCSGRQPRKTGHCTSRKCRRIICVSPPLSASPARARFSWRRPPWMEGCMR